MEHKHISHYIIVYVRKNSRMFVERDFIFTNTFQKEMWSIIQ